MLVNRIQSYLVTEMINQKQIDVDEEQKNI